MSLVQYIESNDPIQNVADLLQLHHNNPLGLHPIVQLAIIFVLVEVMDLFDSLIRYRDKQQHYPKLYLLLGLSLVAIFYYCFQSDLPKMELGPTAGQPSAGWFCQPSVVGWPWAIVSWVLLSHVIYALLCAIMQVTAQLTVESGYVENKPWKEWKWGLAILLIGASVIAISWYVKTIVAAWALVAVLTVLTVYCIGKVVADSLRGHKVGWSLLVGLVFWAGAIACLMLMLEVLRGLIFLLLLFVVYFSFAKARKKKPQK